LSDVIARKLTREHTPTDLSERSRCIKKGAYISQPTEPGLADARWVIGSLFKMFLFYF
jgi:hypothetical protein